MSNFVLPMSVVYFLNDVLPQLETRQLFFLLSLILMIFMFMFEGVFSSSGC